MKKKLSLFFILISCSFIAQKATVSLSVDSKNVEIGEQINFTVRANISGDVNIDFPKEFVLGYGTMNGMEQEVNYNTGEVVTIYHFSQNGSFKEDGNYTIYAYVTKNKKAYRSNSVNIKVESKKSKNPSYEENITSRNLQQSIFGIIQKSKIKIYEGEPIVLQAKVYSKLNINSFSDFKPFEIEGGSENKEIEKKPKLLMEREQLNNQTYLTFNYGKILAFPSMSGKLKIKPFEMTLAYDNGSFFSDEINLISNPSYIEVIPLPNNAPNDFIGAVGEFDMNLEIEKKILKLNDNVQLKITLKGYGNLHTVEKPKLKLPEGLKIYGDPEIIENYEFNEKGSEGKITYIYHLQIKKSGIIKIPALSCSYFNPSKKKYIQIKKDKISIEVDQENNSNIVEKEASKISSEKNQASLNDINNFTKNENKFIHSKYFWPTILSPFLIGFVFLLLKKKKNVNPIDNKEIDKQNVLKQIELDYEELKKQLNQKTSLEFCSLLEQFLKDLYKKFSTITEPISKLEIIAFFEKESFPIEFINSYKKLFLMIEETRYNPYCNDKAKNDLEEELNTCMHFLKVNL